MNLFDEPTGGVITDEKLEEHTLNIDTSRNGHDVLHAMAIDVTSELTHMWSGNNFGRCHRGNLYQFKQDRSRGPCLIRIDKTGSEAVLFDAAVHFPKLYSCDNLLRLSDGFAFVFLESIELCVQISLDDIETTPIMHHFPTDISWRPWNGSMYVDAFIDGQICRYRRNIETKETTLVKTTGYPNLLGKHESISFAVTPFKIPVSSPTLIHWPNERSDDRVMFVRHDRLLILAIYHKRLLALLVDYDGRVFVVYKIELAEGFLKDCSLDESTLTILMTESDCLVARTITLDLSM
jgi:hypothetical protein